ncbi:MAG: DUF4214 domain-containing protein [Saccharofermentans sp.]|nr:DUF4214 domain-containing protein [Saccharofermentans sp.]
MNLKKCVAVLLSAICFVSTGVNYSNGFRFDGGDVVRAEGQEEFARAFSERMYTIVLGRPSDPQGINDWSSALVSGQLSGATCAFGFFNSPEFVNKNVSNEEYVDILYKAILGRPADSAGKKDWVDWLDKGMTRNCALNGFINSQEFKTICSEYGIEAGNLELTAPVDKYPYINALVMSSYRSFLERNADPVGLASWVEALSNGTTASQLIEGFIYSKEFINRNLNDREYVNALYLGILGRGASDADIDSWLSFGSSRPVILKGILQSPEFTIKCDEAGVKRGDIDLKSVFEATEIGSEYAEIVFHKILGRGIDAASKESYGAAVANGSTACDILYSIYNSTEFINKDLSDAEFIQNVYVTLLGRPAAQSDIDTWTKTIAESNISRNRVIKGIADSSEFKNRCEIFGITAGEYKANEPRDLNPLMSAYVINMYKSMLGAAPDIATLNDWCSKFQNNQATGSSFVKTLAADPAFTSKSLDDQIIGLYNGALMRGPSSSDLESMRAVANKSGFDAVMEQIFGSAEFKNMCLSKGIQPNYIVGWNNTPSGRVYFDGTKLLSGWQRIDGQRYYFGSNKTAAWGWTRIGGYKYYFNPSTNALVQDVTSVIGNRNTYYLDVNCATCVITVYTKSETGRFDLPVKALTCSTGRDATPTIKGTFTCRRTARWGVLNGPVYGQYCSQISGNYLFHSSWYHINGNQKSLSVCEYNQLGKKASHGCVRLCTRDAKWIYDYASGSKVTIYDTPGAFQPFDKPVLPKAIVVKGDFGIDPTDPNL